MQFFFGIAPICNTSGFQKTSYFKLHNHAVIPRSEWSSTENLRHLSGKAHIHVMGNVSERGSSNKGTMQKEQRMSASPCAEDPKPAIMPCLIKAGTLKH